MREVLLPISITVVLPIVIVWLNIKSKKHESDNRTGVLLAAIEKNSDVDIEELMRKMNMQDKSHTTLKERLLKKLLWGSIVTAVGIGLLGQQAVVSAVAVGDEVSPVYEKGYQDKAVLVNLVPDPFKDKK